MAATKTDRTNSSLFETFSNKLNTVRSNRSLVAANQQLRIQLAFAKAEVNRLQNEIVNLQRRIAGLESTSDEERIEMIVRRRLQQRVQHLKSIANRTVQYMEKTKADFDHAASRFDHALSSSNFDDNAIDTGKCNQNVTVPSVCETGDEIVGRRVQRLPTLEAVEEDIYGEMDENEDVISDRDLIIPVSGDEFIRTPGDRKSGRNNRRETFFVKRDSLEFENDTEISFAEVSFPETSETVSSSSTQNHEEPQGVDVLMQFITPTTISVSRNSTTFSKLETPTETISSLSTDNHEDPPAIAVTTELTVPTTTSVCRTPTTFSEFETPPTCSSSRLLPKKTHAENTPAKNSQSEVVMHTRKKRKISTNESPRNCKRSSENSTKTTKETNNLLRTPASTNSTGILSVVNLNEGVRNKRAAAAKISSFKEPNLVTKMRNPNVN